MAGFLGFLLCLWEPVQAALLSCLGTAVGDCLTFLRGRAVAQLTNLTSSWGNPQFELINTPTADLVGWEEISGNLKKIVDYLKDEAVRSIGIYGMGGVGKTTLLQMLHNDFHKIGAPGSYVLIWVTVSKEDASILNIQKQIVDKLRLNLSADTAGSSSQAEEQAKAIFKAFSNSKRRFLLLLDDVWEKLDLVKVGIPCPTRQNNKCIIILTTRSKEVCINMGAKHHLVNVNELNASESWKLFKEKLGPDVNLDDPRIKLLARGVADKCGGLPLALITVGCSMAEATTAGEWEEALEQLKETPHKLPGMKDKVFSLLKFSFDRLGDENTQQCLLYCCLFPEDHEIPVEEVIEYWVGEGFLDDTRSDSIVRARNRGHGVITKLKSACLLETGRKNVSCVKMHDVVREMCLWLTGGEFDKGNKFLVYAGSDDVPISKTWGDAKRISLMYNSSQALPHNIPSCPNLRTLLCKRFIREYGIPEGFFECMPALCVLDLSYCWLKSLPEEISFLPELRYLKLQSTQIRSLPGGLGKLAKLSQLDLSFCPLERLREEISFLAELRDLKLRNTKIWWLPGVLGKLAKLSHLDLSGSRLQRLPKEINFLAELRYLNLQNTNIESLPRGLGKLAKLSQLDLSGSRLESLPEEISFLAELRDLNLRNTKIRSLPGGLGKLAKLSQLDLSFCPLKRLPEEISFLAELRDLKLGGTQIRDLMWIRQLPRLEEIELTHCEGMEELLPEVNGGLEERGVDDDAVDCDRASLLALRRLSLYHLPALKSISWRPLLLPSLEYLHVSSCPQLKKLPLGPDSAENIREIRGEREWWESLEWHQDADGGSVKARFLPYFVGW